MGKICLMLTIGMTMLFLLQCKENINPVQINTAVDHPPLYSRAPCCNNMFHGFSQTPTDTTELECLYHNNCRTIKLRCANLWSEVAPKNAGQLDDNYCRYDCTAYPDEPSWCTAEKQGNYSRVEWEFVHCHKYKIYRAMGTGGWQLVRTLNNCLTEGNCGNNIFTDYIGTETNVWYKVATLNFTTQSSGFSPAAYIGEIPPDKK